MPFKEELFAKTFDSKEKDFRSYKFKGDIALLEKFRYIDAQFNVVFSRLDHLIDLLASGKAIMGSSEGIKMVEELENAVEIVNAKSGFYVAYFEKSQQKLEKIKKILRQPELKEDILKAVYRVDSLEKDFGIPKNANEKSTLLNLVENIQSLDKRIRVQEEIIKKMVSVSMGKKMENVKQQIKTEL